VWAALFGEKAFELKRKGEDADMLKDHIKRVHEYCKELSKDHKAKLLSLEVKFRHSQVEVAEQKREVAMLQHELDELKEGQGSNNLKLAAACALVNELNNDMEHLKQQVAQLAARVS